MERMNLTKEHELSIGSATNLSLNFSIRVQRVASFLTLHGNNSLFGMSVHHRFDLKFSWIVA